MYNETLKSEWLNNIVIEKFQMRYLGIISNMGCRGLTVIASDWELGDRG